MKMKYFWIVGITALFASCGSGEETDTDADKPIEQRDDFVDVNSDFDDSKFENPVHLELLRELEICVDAPQDSTPYAACDPNNFEIVEFRSDKDVKDAFILLIRAARMLPGEAAVLPDRVVQVWERENGELVNVNNFIGNIVAMRPGEGDIKDLVLQLNDPVDRVMFDCYFKWNGSQYAFDQVLALNLDDGRGFVPLKESLKDSVSREVYNALVEHKIIYYGH